MHKDIHELSGGPGGRLKGRPDFLTAVGFGATHFHSLPFRSVPIREMTRARPYVILGWAVLVPDRPE